MSPFAAGLALGVLIGGVIGVFVMALLTIARGADDATELANAKRSTWQAAQADAARVARIGAADARVRESRIWANVPSAPIRPFDDDEHATNLGAA